MTSALKVLVMMQTVITWRRPMDASIYPPTGNPCTYLLGNALCYIISGMMLLVVGVIITSLTFQNLGDYKDENKERYAGPVLICAGILVLARGAFSHASRLFPHTSALARRRSLLRRYVREVYSHPLFSFRSSTSLSLCDIQVTDLQECTRSRLYSDDPPPYEVATSDEYLARYLRQSPSPGDYTNQCLEDASPDFIVQPPTPLASDEPPPPSYEEFMNSESMRRTSRI